ncbi:type II toxin-antitoxin system HipA family toxin [Myceligenerans indicum]|uniref:Type II toxin-antitoxin system HipA family toxin n=1 Tax=Myceligenerans indicum TaxID=2593663 RepID=A0ABS1LH86_9MICO|nr:type II toxin-antitoxin system HipA family toxin [Myceligenerans indicum]MBL0885576.1 type II toxin-antitoxin system HipA family toxin [Myceligenerans indicum]
MAIRVEVHLPGGRQVHAGELDLHLNTGGALVGSTFRYDDAYLRAPGAYALCPELPLTPGPIPSAGDRPMFGTFADCQPDQWGRTLLFHAERNSARAQDRASVRLTEKDFLLGVQDETRLGALRLSLDGGETYLAPPRADVPELVELPSLTEAADAVAEHRGSDQDLRLLVAAGTSMGGARPKVTVRDADDELWMAKLPLRTDRWDVQAWEYLTLRLASRAGIEIPVARLHRVDGANGRHSILLTRRFDRLPAGGRIGFLSAESLVQKAFFETIDYRTLAETLADHSGRPSADGHDLFRRVAFTLLVRNVDDHLKNHGFLRRNDGWSMAPLFDVNPDPFSVAESTPLRPMGNQIDREVRVLLETCGSYGLRPEDARQVVAEVSAATAGWADLARDLSLPEGEISLMAEAFENPNRSEAQGLAA